MRASARFLGMAALFASIVGVLQLVDAAMVLFATGAFSIASPGPGPLLLAAAVVVLREARRRWRRPTPARRVDQEAV